MCCDRMATMSLAKENLMEPPEHMWAVVDLDFIMQCKTIIFF